MTWLSGTSRIGFMWNERAGRSGLRVIGAASTRRKCAPAPWPTTSVPPSASMPRTPPAWSMWWCVSTSPADRLARELRARRAHQPHRLRVGHRRVQHDQVVAHLDHQAVVRAALDLVHAGRDFLQPQALRAARVEADVVGVHVGADELAAHHPLVGHVAHRRLRRAGAHVRRDLAGARCRSAG